MADKIYSRARFALRSDTLENWQTENPVLLAGEPAVVTDAEDENWLKIGDGVSNWTSLPFKKGPKGEVDYGYVDASINSVLGDINSVLEKLCGGEADG